MPSPARSIDARRLPLRPPPVGGESFPSYVERLAADLEITLVEALAATGVIDRVHHLEIPFCAGFTLRSERIAAFATNTWLATARVESMFLRRYADVLQWHDIPARVGIGPLTQARRIGVIVRSSNLCPDCIRDDGGAWQTSWMLAWQFACMRHRRLLADVCPSCTSFLGYGATHAIGFLSFPSVPPVPGRCGNSARRRTGAVGRASSPCGHPLEAIDTVELDLLSPVLEAQRVLNALLDGRPRAIDGEDNTAAEYLQELRAVATLLLWTGNTDHYVEMPPAITIALERDFTGVVNNRRWLRDLGTRSDRVLRAAGVLTAAVSFLAAPVPRTLAERLEPLLRQAEKLGTVGDTPQSFGPGFLNPASSTPPCRWPKRARSDLHGGPPLRATPRSGAHGGRRASTRFRSSSGSTSTSPCSRALSPRSATTHSAASAP